MKHISLLIKPVSKSCNMACTYCFYNDVSQKRETENYGKMSIDMLKTLVKKVFLEAKESCSFAFQGGEPTLIGLEFYKELIKLQKKYNKNNIKTFNSIQTNGYALTKDWANFLEEENFLVGISLDGSRELHNISRVNKKGEETYDEVMKTITLFNEFGVNYNILCVLTSHIAKHPGKVYQYFKENGFKFIQFIPCLDPLNEERGKYSYSLTPKAYEKFLKAMFDLWYADCKKSDGISIRHFDNWLGLIMGYPPENCAMGGKCAVYFTVEADGSIYPCDFYVTDKYRLGNIGKDSFLKLIESSAAKDFVAESHLLSFECKACKYYSLCYGGCRRDRDFIKGLGKNYFCDTYKNFFSYTFERFLDIANMKKNPYNL